MAGEHETNIQLPENLAEGKKTLAECAGLYLMGRKLLLASLGALAMSADEAREFLDHLSERGEVAGSEVQSLIDTLVDSVADKARARQGNLHSTQKAAAVADERFEKLLGRLNVPTRSDIEALSQKISELDRKVMALKAKRQGGQPR